MFSSMLNSGVRKKLETGANQCKINLHFDQFPFLMPNIRLISSPQLDGCSWIENCSVGNMELGGKPLFRWMQDFCSEFGGYIVSDGYSGDIDRETLQISMHHFPYGENLSCILRDFEKGNFLPFFHRDVDEIIRPVAWTGIWNNALENAGKNVREALRVHRLVHPWDLLDWNERVLERLHPCRDGSMVSPGAFLSGTIHMGSGCEILPGVVMDGYISIGDRCRIGPNCYIRGHVSIGNDCRIGQGVEIKSSIIGNETCVPHLSYVGDSVIGSRVNLAAGTICSNYRHDAGEHRMVGIHGILMGTGRTKLGAVIGHDARTGCRTTIYPGRIIAPGKTTRPGEIVLKNLV